MRNSVLAAVAALTASVSGVHAQNALADWSGFYVGLFGAATVANVTDDYDLVQKFSFPVSGAVGGGAVGYNMQRGAMVFGVEATMSPGGAKGSGLCDAATTPQCSGSGAKPAFTLGETVGVSVRAGYSSGNNLMYASIGYAAAQASVTDSLQAGTDRHRHNGYSIGIGVERMVRDNISLGLEYRHTAYNTLNYALVTTPDGIGFNTNEIRLSVRYHF